MHPSHLRQSRTFRWDLRWSALLGAGLVSATLGGACGDDGGDGAGGEGGASTSSSSAGGAGGQGGGEAYDWGLPPGYPKPRVPADNPMSAAKVELGRRLFYDTRLSGNQTQSCASCHEQALAFTDGLAVSVGSTGERTPRSSMSTVNTGYLSSLTWANSNLSSIAIESGLLLETQAMVPLFGEDPVELGLSGMDEVMLERLRAEPVYQAAFPAAFPDESDPFSVQSVLYALAAFQRSILSYRSAYDRYNYGGDPTALSASALRGRELFFGERLECFHCHGGFNFSDSVAHEGTTFDEVMFHNNGLYNVGGTGDYPEDNTGLYELTGVPSDMGRFRAPSLRNIALTAPYMHDGSIATLSEVLDHYAAGGRTIETGPYAGDGSQNPYKSELIAGFTLTEEERADVLAFLESLTDEALLTDPRWSNPWKE